MSEPYWEPLGAQQAIPGLGLIADQIVGATPVNQITFDAIPAIYKHLKIEATWGQSGSSVAWVYARLNGLATNIFDSQYTYASATSLATAEQGAAANCLLAYGYPQNGSFIADFLNYMSNQQKHIHSQFYCDWGGHTTGAAGRHVGQIGNLANLLVPITKIDLISATTFLTGSRFTLYGMV